MGGPGAGRVNRHELNAVPKSQLGHGDRILVIEEPPSSPTPASTPRNTTPTTTPTTTTPASGTPGPVRLVIEDSGTGGCRCHSIITGCPIPGTPTYVAIASDVNNNPTCPLIADNNNNRNNNKDQTSPNVGSKGAKGTGGATAAAMSSPPKHRRGFDPNDANVNDYRRYRRVKTRQRGFVCSTP